MPNSRSNGGAHFQSLNCFYFQDILMKSGKELLRPGQVALPECQNLCPYLFIFNWRIIAIQCCVSVCCTTMWISHKYTCIPSLLASLPFRLSSSPRGRHGALSWAPCACSAFPLAVDFTRDCASVSLLLSQFLPRSPSPAVSTSPFSTSVSLFLFCKY